MKPTSHRTTIVAGMAALVLHLALCPIAQAAEPPTPRSRERPFNWYSAQNLDSGAKVPPLPGNPFPDLPVYQLDEWSWVYDDRAVDYEKLRSQAAATSSAGQGAALMSMGAGDPTLLIAPGSNAVTLTIASTNPAQVFDLFKTYGSYAYENTPNLHSGHAVVRWPVLCTGD